MTTGAVLGGLALAGLLACGKGIPQLADGERAENPAETPAPSGPTTRTLAAFAQVDATMDLSITSRTNRPGQAVTMTVSGDVRNAGGDVVIPAGSRVEMLISLLQPARYKRQRDGRMAFRVIAATVRGQRYPVQAEVTSMSHSLMRRGVAACAVEQEGGWTMDAALVGRGIGGYDRVVVIGGSGNAAVGAVVASEGANRDVIIAMGAPVLITLTGPLTVATD